MNGYVSHATWGRFYVWLAWLSIGFVALYWMIMTGVIPLPPHHELFGINDWFVIPVLLMPGIGLLCGLWSLLFGIRDIHGVQMNPPLAILPPAVIGITLNSATQVLFLYALSHSPL